MEDKYEIIEKYLMNELSIRDQIQFEENLRKDPELRKEYEVRKKINEALLEDDIINLRDLLQEVMNEGTEHTKPTRKLYVISSVAAVIVLFIVIAGKILFFSDQLSSADLYDTYYETYTAVMNFRSTNTQNQTRTSLANAFDRYEAGDFKQASFFFEKIVREDNSNYMCRFYLSICKMETNKPDEAEEYLTGLVLKNNHIFWEQAHWYLALLYLKMNSKKEAKMILNKMVHENMAQKTEAKIILKSLE